MRIRTLIVDDEPPAREKLRTLLRHEPDIDLAGECADGQSAVEAILRLEPDLVFLDVEMPGIDGFDVIDAIGPYHVPAVVFVATQGAAAVRVLEIHALEVLLKPFDHAQFTAALTRARGELRRDGAGEQVRREIQALLAQVRSERGWLARIVVKDRGRVFFVGVDEIDWIEAAGNYLSLHARGEQHLVRETMRALEQRLDPARFLRVHRSAIVNVDRIVELRPGAHGDFVVVLASGAELTSSRGYSEQLRKRMDGT